MHPLPLGTREAEYKNGEPFIVPPDARRKHMAMFGATGTGKSTALRNMIAWDIANGAGVTVVDPHGDLIEDLLDNHITRARTNDVVYINPKDPEHTPRINILERTGSMRPELVASHVVGIFKHLYADSWGARLEDILRNSVLALIGQPTPVSLAAIPKLLTDDPYRAQVLTHVRNPVVRNFFEDNYNEWKDGFREEAISAVLNKIRALLSDPLLLAIIGPVRSSFNFRWAIDHRKIILVDLSKGVLGEDNAKLLGAVIVALERLAALSRADIPEEERVPHILYVDEAHNFVADFESIFAEARKYWLPLVLTTQGSKQLREADVHAIFTNVATIASFRVSGADAERLKSEFVMQHAASELQDMPNFQLRVRTLVENEQGVTRPTGPHIVNSYPPLAKSKDDNDRERVVRTSRERFTRRRADVLAAINKFLVTKPKEEPVKKEPRPNPTITRLKRVEEKIDRAVQFE